MTPLANVERIDTILDDWKPLLGPDYDGYRNHVVRMVTFCLMLKPCTPEEQHKIEIAACFHDIGIWPEQTLDYLAPSVPPAMRYLETQGLGEWSEEIQQMILDHHKLSPVRDAKSALVELFRQGDLIDFSLGFVRFGLSRREVEEVKAAFPNKGFHKTLMRLSRAWVPRNLSRPFPMMKW